MKFILCQPAQIRFQWELDIALTNILSLREDAEICVLFGDLGNQESFNVIDHIASRYPTVEVHAYTDNRDNKSYYPSIKPYLMYKYLIENRQRESDTYFCMDSDVIFRELPDFDSLGGDMDTYVGSDCAGYIDYKYITSCQRGTEVVQYFATLTEMTKDELELIPGAGAQWYITNPTAEMWLKAYNDGNTIWEYFQTLDSNIQKWTAEMWSTLYAFAFYGKKIIISPELDFCRPTDNVKMWDMVKIFHNAGVTAESSHYMFYKGQYVEHTPFGEDLGFVRRDKASIKYVEAVKMVKI